MSRELSRKELLRGVFSLFRQVQEGVEAIRPPASGNLVRPPGALAPDEAYLAACTGCEACVQACPHGAIEMHELAGTPPRRVAVLEPERRPCRMCAELPCIPVCKDGALAHPGALRQVHMGVAQIDPRTCRTFRGVACDLCVRYCPFPDEAVRLIGLRPVVMPGACTGCGICAFICPDRAIRVFPERELVAGLRIPREIKSSARFSG